MQSFQMNGCHKESSRAIFGTKKEAEAIWIYLMKKALTELHIERESYNRAEEHRDEGK